MIEQGMPEEMPVEGQEQEQVAASPEEQRTHDAYVKEALKPVASNGNVWQGMLKTLRAAKSRITESVAMIAVRLYTMAEEKLGPLDDEDISEAVAESIIEQILIAGIAAGILGEKEVTDDLAIETYLRFVKLWTQQNPNRVSPEDIALTKGRPQGQQPPQQQPAQPNILGAQQ